MNTNSNQRLFYCLDAFPSGEREELVRTTSQLHNWLPITKSSHPDAALFVDGKCRYQGQFSDEAIAQIEREIR
ncbi:hypothetical protein SAMN06265795_12217 [Noviherbaspirillum humi]|uniref:Uncharacterized protein n=1 Tax=Noviherbaspirillum humi TaxID=1688639 RepID=A0A239LDQ4_9BURK|nr:hypothetical protein [Noviherbaspirillum humi]SNT28611.1 hypothetical protein SAMN06265795_12217 [Noviherbaspirillum humi]